MKFPEYIYAQLVTVPPVPTASLSGQTVIITGSNRGLGFEAAKHIVRLGASKLILAVRSVAAGEVAKTEILKSASSSSPSKSPTEIEVWPLDLKSYDSVKVFVKRAEKLPRLDALANNAGIATTVYKTAEDNESSITVNVISAFLLTMLLLPTLRSSAEKFNTVSRVTMVGSEGMNWVAFKERNAADGAILETLNDQKTADMQNRYFLTKLFIMFSVRELAGLMDASRKNRGGKGGEVVLHCVSPGYVNTDLAHERRQISAAFRMYERIMGRDVEVGSRIVADGITRGRESHGQYLSECKIKPVSKFMRSPEGKKLQQRVWSEILQKLEKIQPGIEGNI